MNGNRTESLNDALRAAVQVAGSQSALARCLGVTQHAVWRWLRENKPLPAKHVLATEAATGISRHRLRPDLYPRESSILPERRDDAGELEAAE